MGRPAEALADLREAERIEGRLPASDADVLEDLAGAYASLSASSNAGPEQSRPLFDPAEPGPTPTGRWQPCGGPSTRGTATWEPSGPIPASIRSGRAPTSRSYCGPSAFPDDPFAR